jgi:hypothetical protein
MPLLLFGCPLFARFLIPSQVKPVAVKRHRKRVRLKTDALVNDSKASVQNAVAIHTTSNAFAFYAALWNTGCHWTSFTAAAFALLVAEYCDCSVTSYFGSDASLGQHRLSCP